MTEHMGVISHAMSAAKDPSLSEEYIKSIVQAEFEEVLPATNDLLKRMSEMIGGFSRTKVKILPQSLSLPYSTISRNNLIKTHFSRPKVEQTATNCQQAQAFLGISR